MDNKFSIGEMAKLHNTTIKTLHHYHKIDLLVPIYTDQNNGYRYYSTEQFEQLNTITYLKELGFSLREIKQHLEHRDIDGFLLLLEEQKLFAEQKIKELERTARRVDDRITNIRYARKIEALMTPLTKTLETRQIIKLAGKISSEPDLEINLRHLENQANLSASLFIGGVGLTVSMHDILNDKFNEYNSIFILDEDRDADTSLSDVLPGGKYACVYYNGSHSHSYHPYKQLLEYIHENNYKITGDAVERTIINQYISSQEEDYLTEFQIPIES
ncbi:MerR family transcriptional regulator [Salinicoccus sesuvii]